MSLTLLLRNRGLKQAACMLELGRKVEFVSIGRSYPVAYTARNELRLIGIPAATQSDAHIQLIAATQLQKGNMAFGISCSGSTYETVQCMQVARENKATTLSITNCMKPPISAQSDLVLYATPSEIKYFQAPLASRITQLASVDALFMAISSIARTRPPSNCNEPGKNSCNIASKNPV